MGLEETVLELGDSVLGLGCDVLELDENVLGLEAVSYTHLRAHET